MNHDEVVSIRLPRGLKKAMKALAHRESIARGRDVSWARLTAEALQGLLDSKKKATRSS